MSRSKVLVVAVVLLGVAVSGCTAGQATDQPDPCASAMAIGDAILAETEDKTVRAGAVAAHIIAHATCYEAETVASARVALAQIHQQEQWRQTQCPTDVTYSC